MRPRPATLAVAALAVAAGGAGVGGPASAWGQELSVAAPVSEASEGTSSAALAIEPTPNTSLIDLGLFRHPASRAAARRGLPIWLESVQVDQELLPGETLFRLRLRPVGSLDGRLFLRLFFEDRPDARPTVSSWTETGECRFASEPLGAGLGLPASEALVIMTEGVDYLEISVPGDGSGIRQLLVAAMGEATVSGVLDFAPPSELALPFDAAAPREPAPGDTFLFGRVRAELERGPVTLSPLASPEQEEATHTASFSFDLEAAPLLALLVLDLLNPDPTAPLLAWVNDKPVGPVAMQLPDLADPGYRGVARPLEPMGFHYAGWVRAQKAIPGHFLRPGENVITLQLPDNAGPVALRHLELQLKNQWHQLDYTLAP